MRRFLLCLRIAFSAMCVVAIALLIVLWVRSYRYDKTAGLHGERVQHLTSHQRLLIAWSKIGAVHLCVTRPGLTGSGWDKHFAAGRWLGFGLLHEGSSSDVRVPYWFVIVAIGSVAVYPWSPFFSWRFSLRTLLVAMTVVAALMGAIVYAIS